MQYPLFFLYNIKRKRRLSLASLRRSLRYIILILILFTITLSSVTHAKTLSPHKIAQIALPEHIDLLDISPNNRWLIASFNQPRIRICNKQSHKCTLLRFNKNYNNWMAFFSKDNTWAGFIFFQSTHSRFLRIVAIAYIDLREKEFRLRELQIPFFAHDILKLWMERRVFDRQYISKDRKWEIVQKPYLTLKLCDLTQKDVSLSNTPINSDKHPCTHLSPKHPNVDQFIPSFSSDSRFLGLISANAAFEDKTIGVEWFDLTKTPIQLRPVTLAKKNISGPISTLVFNIHTKEVGAFIGSHFYWWSMNTRHYKRCKVDVFSEVGEFYQPSISRNGKRMIAGGWTQPTPIVNLRTCQTKTPLKIKEGAWNTLILPDGKTAIYVDSLLHGEHWDLNRSKRLRIFETSSIKILPVKLKAPSLWFSADHRFIWARQRATVAKWRISDGRLVDVFNLQSSNEEIKPIWFSRHRWAKWKNGIITIYGYRFP